MDNSFDELTRALAGATSRREALRRLGGFVGGALLASVGLDGGWARAGAGDPCKAACRRCSPRTRDQCISVCRACPGTTSLCGPCGAVVCCSGGRVCYNGRCVCPPGLTDCGGYCADLRNDPYNCGGCGRACSGGEVCDNGACGCPSGLTDCGGACVDLASDPNNCGGCGNVCSDPTPHCAGGTCGDPNNCGGGGPCIFPFICCGGVCVDVTSDPYNCGACYLQCAPSEVCAGGFCQSYG
jgi:hypothetical protein